MCEFFERSLNSSKTLLEASLATLGGHLGAPEHALDHRPRLRLRQPVERDPRVVGFRRRTGTVGSASAGVNRSDCSRPPVMVRASARAWARPAAIRHLRAGVLTHAAGCREVNGADVALAWHGSARLVDEGAIRLDPGQEARGHEVPDLGAEHPVRLHRD